MKLRLAVTMRRVTDPVHGELRDALSVDWTTYLAQNWPDLVILPVANHPEMVMRWADDLSIDAVLLTNGNDWGAAPERDATEALLVQWCRDRQKPVIGVCRGLQALNKMMGGALEQDLGALVSQSHAGVTHAVNICSDDFQEFAGAETLTVNSYHDQGVTQQGLADGLVPFAVTSDDVIEGFYHPDEPILAIQWHPERPGGPDAFNRRLIQAGLSGAQWMCQKSENAE